VIQHSRALGLESSVVAQHFRHVPKRFIEPQILINSFDGAALWHPFTVGAAARIIPLAAFRNVLLNRVQGRPEILCAISIAARVEQERRIDRGFVEVFPSVSSCASGKGQALGIGQNRS
jgi:hypothetical protein